MYTNVLVPFDGSEPACRALLTAINLCKSETNADITVLQVTGMANIDYTSFEVAARMSGIDISDELAIQTLRENIGQAIRCREAVPQHQNAHAKSPSFHKLGQSLL